VVANDCDEIWSVGVQLMQFFYLVIRLLPVKHRVCMCVCVCMCVDVCVCVCEREREQV